MVTRALVLAMGMAGAVLGVAAEASAQGKPAAASTATPTATTTAKATATPTATTTATPTATTHAVDPRLHHTPPIVVTADADVAIGARIDRPDLVRRAYLVTPRGDIPFERSSRGDSPYFAVIHAEDVRPPSIRYAIEIERLDGSRISVFATREDMHVVAVNGDVVDERERILLERLHGRRSVVNASGEYVSFGSTSALVWDGAPPAPGAPTPPLKQQNGVQDGYYRVEAAYTYRILRTVAEFGIRAGVVRGKSVVEGEHDLSKYDVGLNYGAPHLRLRAADWLHFEGEFLTSVTEVGFSIGGGGEVILGDPYGSKIALGFESVQVFGSRGYSRVDIVASRRLLLSPIIEVTNMPHAASTGLRLLGELGIDFGQGFGLAIRGGYQARTFNVGGPTAGLNASYSF